jgi:hypothetical protein
LDETTSNLIPFITIFILANKKHAIVPKTVSAIPVAHEKLLLNIFL